MNDSGYGSFEDSNAVLHRAGTFAQRRHIRKDVAAAVYDLSASEATTPATPISPPESGYDPVSVHSRNPSYGSVSGPERSIASSPDADVDVDSGSPAVSNDSPFPANTLPAPYIPLRKESLNRLRLSIDTSRKGVDLNNDQSSPTPFARDSRIGNSPPRLPRDRQASLPTPEPTPKAERIPAQDDELFLPPAAPALRSRARGFTSTSQNGPPPSLQIKPSASIPDLASLRRNFMSSTYRPDRGPTARNTNSSVRSKEPPMPWTQDEVRASYRSAMTNGSYIDGEARASFRSGFTNGSHLTYASSFVDASETERSSVVTRASSISDSIGKNRKTPYEDEGLSVDDAIDMYVAGFPDLEQKPDQGIIDIAAYMPSPVPEEPRSAPLPSPTAEDAGITINRFFEAPDQPKPQHSLDAPLLPLPDAQSVRSLSPPPFSPSSPAEVVVFEMQAFPRQFPVETKTPPTSPPLASSSKSLPHPPPQRPPTRTSPSPPHSQPEVVQPVPRDRYGFKKQTQQVTVAQYDEWQRGYTEYLDRRREKWYKLMRQHGLPTDKPDRFPPKTDKVKRYIRKGIPPEWRGAAWFWYAGGPQRLISESGVYWELIERVERGFLSDTDREHIERDLNRTFPDNIKFKHEVGDRLNENMPGRDIRPHGHSGPFETPILRALRRVLQAFAIHNPSIGYCQSLNFLAGLLLLFLDEDEEKAFILLNIITTKHLPGTHAKVLEANVDIGVLMSCIRESMPAIWAKIDDNQDHPPVGLSTTRLPTVSLATTSWFMSLFIGTLPIECVLRVWDCLFYEGSKTLFRIALAIFKAGEQEIRSISDPMEIFQVVQQIPRRMIDVNGLMEACYKRRNGFGHLSQETVEKRRDERRKVLKRDRARANGELLGYDKEEIPQAPEETRQNGLRRAASRARLRRALSRRRPPPSRDGQK